MRSAWAFAAICIAACWRAPKGPPTPPIFEGIELARSQCTRNGLLLPVDLDGVRGWFLLDSGAFVDVVYERFARRAGLRLVDNAGRIGGGMGVRVLQVRPKSFAIPGLPDVAPPALVMLGASASPLARGGCDVAGVISPARLAGRGVSVLVDFAAARLARVPDSDVDGYLTRIAGSRFAAVTRDDEYAPGIDVAFGDHQLRMMVDTGACCTWVTTTSRVGRAHLPASKPSGTVDRLSGTLTSRAARAHLRFGDVARSLDIKLLDPTPGDAREDGAIGADALASCIVAVSPGEIRGRCR